MGLEWRPEGRVSPLRSRLQDPHFDALVLILSAFTLAIFLVTEIDRWLSPSTGRSEPAAWVEVTPGVSLSLTDRIAHASLPGALAPEPDGTWLGSSAAQIRVRTLHGETGFGVGLTVFAPEYVGSRSRSIVLSVNQKEVATMVAPGSLEIVHVDTEFAHEFDIRVSCSPAERPPNGDERELCVKMLELVVLP